MIDLQKLEKFIKKRNKFSSKQFGTKKERGCLGPLHHLKKEVQELIDNPDDEMEWADNFLLLLDAAWRKGHSLQDLINFADKKLDININRKWGEPDKDGVYQHIK